MRTHRSKEPLFLRCGESDIEVLLEVYLERECALPAGVPTPRVILDGGANVGYTARWLAIEYSEALVLAVEPDPASAAMARRNTESFGERVRVVESALWNEDGHVRLVNPGDPSWSHRFETAREGEAGALPCRSIGSLLDSEGVGAADVVKLDVEGAERGIFGDGDLGWMDSISVLIVETHGEEADRVVRAALSARGFRCRVQGEKLVATRQP